MGGGGFVVLKPPPEHKKKKRKLKTYRKISFKEFVVVVFFFAVRLTLALIEAVLGIRMKEFVKLEESFPKSRGIERCPRTTGTPQHGEDVIGPKLPVRYVDFG